MGRSNIHQVSGLTEFMADLHYMRSLFAFAILFVLVGCTTNKKQDLGPISQDWQQSSAEDTLTNGDPEVVANGITLLGTMDATTSLPRVLSAYKSYQTNKAISRATATYLGKVRGHPETSLAILSDMLHNPDSSVVDAAVAAVGEYRESATILLPTLLGLHKAGSLVEESGIPVEHPPTSSALSEIGITATGQVDVLLESAKNHGPEVFAAIRGDDLKRYAVGRLLKQLSAASEEDSQNRILDELRQVNIGTQDEFARVKQILAQESSATTIVAQGKAALLVPAIVKSDPQIGVAPIVGRLSACRQL